MTEIFTHTLTGREGITITYTGTGTATGAIASNTLTIARANVHGCTLTYTGTGTATAAIASDVLTIARANVNAFTLTFTGEGTCTATVGSNTLTITRGETPTAYDLTNESYNTLTELVAALDGESDLTCTIADGATGSHDAGLLEDLEATDITTPLVLTYAPADVTYDLTNALYDDLNELVAVLHAIGDLTCVIDAGATADQDTATLDDITATSIDDGLVITYTPANATYDLTNASYDTIAELQAALDALGDIVCSKTSSIKTYNASKHLEDKAATSLASAVNFTMNDKYVDAALGDLGLEIPCQGHKGIVLYAKIDINTIQNLRFKIMAKHTASGADLYPIEHSTILSATTTSEATNGSYLELDSDADQNIVMVIPNLYGANAIQIQKIAGGGTADGLVTELKYSYVE